MEDPTRFSYGWALLQKPMVLHGRSKVILSIPCSICTFYIDFYIVVYRVFLKLVLKKFQQFQFLLQSLLVDIWWLLKTLARTNSMFPSGLPDHGRPGPALSLSVPSPTPWSAWSWFITYTTIFQTVVFLNLFFHLVFHPPHRSLPGPGLLLTVPSPGPWSAWSNRYNFDYFGGLAIEYQ